MLAPLFFARGKTDFGQEKSGYIGWGYVVPKPESRRQIDSLAGELAGKLSGALCFTRFFNMVVYPVGSNAWAFLDQKLPIVPEVCVLTEQALPESSHLETTHALHRHE